MGRRRKKRKGDKAHKKRKKAPEKIRPVDSCVKNQVGPGVQVDEEFTRCSHTLQEDDVRAVIYEIFYLFERGLANHHYAQCKAVTEHYNEVFRSAGQCVRANNVFHSIEDSDHSIEPIYFFQCGQSPIWGFIKQYPLLCSANIQYLNFMMLSKTPSSDAVLRILEMFCNFLMNYSADRFLVLFHVKEFDDIDSINQHLISYLYSDISRKIFDLINLLSGDEKQRFIVELGAPGHLPAVEAALIESTQSVRTLAQKTLERYYYHYSQFLKANLSNVEAQNRLAVLDTHLQNLDIERPFAIISCLLSETQLIDPIPQALNGGVVKPSVTFFEPHIPDVDEDDCSDISSSTGSIDVVPIEIPINIDVELSMTPNHFFMPTVYTSISFSDKCFSFSALKLIALLRAEGILAFVCGGKVLEVLGLKTTYDTDMVITASMDEAEALLLANNFCNTNQITINGDGLKSTMRLTFEKDCIDIQAIEKPGSEHFAAGNIWNCLTLDANKRDLGVNAIYLHLTGSTTAHLYDPSNALSHVENHELSAAMFNYNADHFSLPQGGILRAIRIALEISIHTKIPYQLEERIYRFAFIEHALVLNTSAERRGREWSKIQVLLQSISDESCIHPTTLSLIEKIDPILSGIPSTSVSSLGAG